MTTPIHYPPPDTVHVAASGLLHGPASLRTMLASMPREAWPSYAHPMVDAVTALLAARQPIDAAAVRAWLLEREHSLVGELLDLVVGAADWHTEARVQAAAQDMLDRLHRHRAQRVMLAGSEAVADLDRALPEVLDATVHQLTTVGAAARPDGPMSMQQVCGALIDYVGAERTRARESSIPGMTELIGEYLPGEVYVIAARPGAGKTAYALGECLHIARRGVPVYVQSLEMNAAMVGARMLGVLGGHSVSALIRRDARELTRAADTMLRLSELPIRMWDDGATVELVCQRARLLHERGQCGVVMVDYLTLLTPSDPRAVREQQVAHMSRSLKALAKELAIPVLMVCQLNRMSEGRKGGEPILADLRDSGQIEQDAACVVFPHRPSVYDASAADTAAVLIVAKNRYGATGRVPCVWDGPASRFVAPDHHITHADDMAPAPPLPDMPDYD